MKTPFSFSSTIFSVTLAFCALAITNVANADSGHQHSTNDAAAGIAGKASAITRTVNIAMDDNMRFSPANVSVKQGETIKFIVANNGKLPHEMVIGNAAALAKHAEMMRQMPGMKHKESNQITVASGKTGELIWQFNQATTVDFACLEPGHFEAGMKGQIEVKASK